MTAGHPKDRATDGCEAEREQLHAFLELERDRCKTRREEVFGVTRNADGSESAFSHYRPDREGWTPIDGNWALALSGGGIRSSTFCLGVLQGLAKPLAYSPSLPPSFNRRPGQPEGLLPLFDYVSSVSGGGFAAGFLQSLYAPKPAMPTAAEVQAQLVEEPPGRVHSGIPQRP